MKWAGRLKRFGVRFGLGLLGILALVAEELQTGQIYPNLPYKIRALYSAMSDQTTVIGAVLNTGRKFTTFSVLAALRQDMSYERSFKPCLGESVCDEFTHLCLRRQQR